MADTASGAAETAEIPASFPLEPSPAQLAVRFNRDNARAMAARSWEARKQRRIAAHDDPPQPAQPALPSVDTFPARLKARVRGQTGRLLDMLASEKDPQRLDRLAAALARLAEIERQLSGRPLPGSLRPTQRKERQSLDAVPLPDVQTETGA